MVGNLTWLPMGEAGRKRRMRTGVVVGGMGRGMEELEVKGGLALGMTQMSTIGKDWGFLFFSFFFIAKLLKRRRFI